MYERISTVALEDASGNLEYIPEMASISTLNLFWGNRKGTESPKDAMEAIQINQFLRNKYNPKHPKVDYFSGWESAFDTIHLDPLAKAKFDTEGMKWMESGNFTKLFDRDFPSWREL